MSSYAKQTGKTIKQAFDEFHEKNPEIYGLIKKQVQRALKAGKKKLSIKQIVGWIRWEYFISTKDETSNKLYPEKDNVTRTFKINDAYTAHYSRLLLKDFPAYEPFIETRELRS